MQQLKSSVSEPTASLNQGRDISFAPGVELARPSRKVLVDWLRQVSPIRLAAGAWFAAIVVVLCSLFTPTLTRSGQLHLTEGWGALERVALWQRSLSWIPGLTNNGSFVSWPADSLVWPVRLGMGALFALQAWAIWRVWTTRETQVWKWMLGPIGVHAAMLFFTPTNADLFFYAMSGNIANSGHNPYAEPLLNFSNDPFLPYNHWVEMTSVYGPFWTNVSRALVWIGRSDPIATVWAFKLSVALTVALLVWLVYKLAYRLTGQAHVALTAAVLVAWQPNWAMDGTGHAHNDALMILLAACGVALAIYGGERALRGAIVLATASVMIKYATLPVLGLLGLLRTGTLRQRHGVFRLLGSWVLDGIAIAAVLLTGWLPYWEGPQVLRELAKETGRLFTHPLWSLPKGLLSGEYVGWYEDGARIISQLLTVGLVLYAGGLLARKVWSGSGAQELTDGDLPWWTGHLLIGFTIVVVAMSFVPVNSHPWYWTWSSVPIALLVAWQSLRSRGVLPNWLWWYVGATGFMTIVYNTRVPN